MNLPSDRTQTVIQTWDFLIALTRDTGLPDSVQEEVHWLLRHYPYPVQECTPLTGQAPTATRGEIPRISHVKPEA
ncbi:hypothetical protein FQZ97_1081930 [compost metagenome]